MGQNRMDVGEVRMSFAGGEGHAGRTEQISRLTFEHLHRMMDSRLKKMDQSTHLNYLSVGPIRVSFDAMTDDAIAQESATEIYRALLGSF
jgi:hypothetical protein